MSRQLTPHERNFLLKHGFNIDSPLLQSEIPVEYLVGKAEFRGQDFFVNDSTLIPRLETEQIVDLALKNITNNFSPNQKIIIADLCTGSGCIGVSLAIELLKNNSNFHLYFSDISEEALKVARKNYNYFLPDYPSLATFIKSNLFNDFPQNTDIDLVISNPPYIPTNRIISLDNSVKNYEPIQALDGGPEGVTLINKIISELPKYQKKVNAILEVDDTFNLDKIKSEGLKPSLIKDTFGVNRFLSLFLL